MNCLHCGAKMEKSDIFCITCGTPVLTDDDITLMPNAETTKFVNEAQYSGPDPHTDDALYTAIVPSETVIFDNRSDTGQDELSKEKQQSDLQPQNKNNRGKLIAALSVSLALLLGFGLFFFFRSPDTPHEDADLGISSSDTNGEQDQTDPLNDPHGTVPPDVTAIVLLSEGRAQTEFHTKVNETISLHVMFEPDGATADVTWASSDPAVLQIRLNTESNGLEADIWGITAGVADIIISAGGIEERFVVFVDNLPMHDQLAAVIAENISPIWLTLTWTDGQNAGKDIILERNPDNLTWTLTDAFDIIDVHPDIGSDNNALTIKLFEFEGIFYLFADGTGFIADPRSSVDLQEFRWEFKTTLIEPEG